MRVRVSDRHRASELIRGNLKLLRQRSGLSIYKVATALGNMDKKPYLAMKISHLENRCINFSSSLMMKLAKIYGCRLADFYREDLLDAPPPVQAENVVRRAEGGV